ncbi:MAG: hypothetical protein ABIR55_02240, partial [Burkholderiaceae bacterium]
MAASGGLLSAPRKPCNVGSICSPANASLPRKSSGAVVWLMPNAQTAIVRVVRDYKIATIMGSIGLANHLFNFALPAIVLAVMMPLLLRWTS